MRGGGWEGGTSPRVPLFISDCRLDRQLSLRVPKLLSAGETDSLSVSAGRGSLAVTLRIQSSPEGPFLSPSPWTPTPEANA